MSGSKSYLSTFKYALAVVGCCCLMTLNSFSQELVFCEKVDGSGKPFNTSTAFTISKKGGAVELLISSPLAFGNRQLTIDLFLLDKQQHETFENTIRLKVEPSWTWSVQSMTFYKAGTYVVYAYDEYGKLLGTRQVEILMP